MRGQRIVVTNLVKTTTGSNKLKLLPDKLRYWDKLPNKNQLMKA